MISETETVLDRRKMRRSVTFWRSAAILALALAVGAYIFGSDKLAEYAGTKHIARVSIEGTITESRQQLKMLKKIADSKNAAALIVFVNSPGGTTSGGEALYEALREVSKKKPVVAQFGTVAASAGYIVGLGSDHIVARGNTITGSVGVIIQWPEVAELLSRFGVKVNEVRSGELKAIPSPFQPLDEAGRRITKEMVADSNKWFQSIVEERRGIRIAEVPGLDQGRIYSGREAQRMKLVDEIGGEGEAIKWLEEKKGIKKDLKVVDWKPASDRSLGALGVASSGLVETVLGSGAGRLAELLSRDRTVSVLGLDGLVSVWHPGEN